MEAATQKDEQQKDEQKADGDGNVGTVEEIQGVVVEVAFQPSELPEIYNALEVELSDYDDEEHEDEAGTLVLEVQQHLGDDRDPRGGHGRHRRPRARHRGARHRRADHRARSGEARSAASSTCSASRSTRAARSKPRSAGRSTAPRRTSRT